MKKSLVITLSAFTLCLMAESRSEVGYAGHHPTYAHPVNTAKNERREAKDFDARSKGKKRKKNKSDEIFRPEATRSAEENLMRSLTHAARIGAATLKAQTAGVYRHPQHQQQPVQHITTHVHHHGVPGVFQGHHIQQGPSAATPVAPQAFAGMSADERLARAMRPAVNNADVLPPPPPPQQRPQQIPEAQRQMAVQVAAAASGATIAEALQRGARAIGVDADDLSNSQRMAIIREHNAAVAAAAAIPVAPPPPPPHRP